MLQKISPATFSLLAAAFTLAALTSCGGAPVKPSVELGVIDYPANQVIENMSGGASFKKIDAITKATAQNVTRAVVSTGNRVPLSSYDKAICFRPDWWDVEVNYIHSLERYISAHCGGQ